MTNHKVCTACRQNLPFCSYAASKQGRYGLKSECRDCLKKRDAEYREKNRARLREYKRDWRATSPAAENEREHARKNMDKIKSRTLAWQRSNKDLANAKNGRRRAAKLQATPRWADNAAIAMIYSQAQIDTERTGVLHSVDHIVTLKSKIVCGLHCEQNLRVITFSDNARKKNSYWPDMP